MEKAPKLAIRYDLLASKPLQLRLRLEQELVFSYYHLSADVDGLMAHAVKVLEAFEKVDNNPQRPWSPKNGWKNLNCCISALTHRTAGHVWESTNLRKVTGKERSCRKCRILCRIAKAKTASIWSMTVNILQKKRKGGTEKRSLLPKRATVQLVQLNLRLIATQLAPNRSVTYKSILKATKAHHDAVWLCQASKCL